MKKNGTTASAENATPMMATINRALVSFAARDLSFVVKRVRVVSLISIMTQLSGLKS